MENLPLQGHVLDVRHLPLIREALSELGILSVLARRCPQHVLSPVSDAECAAVLILNILSGKQALYQIEDWVGSLDVPLLLGRSLPPSAFNDTRLAQCLSHIDDVGTDHILSDIVDTLLRMPEAPTTYSLHQDASTLVLWGAYDRESDLTPARGFSKDHRPDLKQLVFGLTVRGTDALPLAFSFHDGNTADQAVNRTHLERLAEQIPPEHDVTLVADCKACDGVTLGQFFRESFHVITLVPETFSLRQELVDAAWQQRPILADWPVLAQKPQARKADPPLFYRGWSVEAPFVVQLAPATDDTAAVLSTETLRFLIVASDTLAAQFEEKLPQKLTKEREALEKETRRINAKGFACAADAQEAAQKLVKKAKLHRAVVSVGSTERVLPREGRGRPPKGAPVATETRWRAEITWEENASAIAQARRRGSCFVLLTDHLDEQAWSDAQILAEYRHQSAVEGYSGFRWMKSEAMVAPVFLKTPERIRAMGLLFVLALMVRNYLQFTLRRRLAETRTLLPHPFTRQPVADLTAEMAFVHFQRAQTIAVQPPIGEPFRIAPTLSDTAVRILELLNISPDRFRIPFPPIPSPKIPDAESGPRK